MKTFEEIKQITNAIDCLMVEVGIKEYYITLDNGGEFISIYRTYPNSIMEKLRSENLENIKNENL